MLNELRNEKEMNHGHSNHIIQPDVTLNIKYTVKNDNWTLKITSIDIQSITMDNLHACPPL
jgi:hypothetical protein